MTFKSDLQEGARNLLINCAELNSAETVVIISENHELGWYEADISNVLYEQARHIGIEPTLLEVGKPENRKNPLVINAVDDHDCTIFLARIGDQNRFETISPGKKTIMCYTRDVQMLASPYGRANYKAFVDLKMAINEILLSSSDIRITCSNGTDMAGKLVTKNMETAEDVSVRRFPLGVPQPIIASAMSGQVALVDYLTPTGSKVYTPDSIGIENIVLAQVRKGIIIGFEGDVRDVQKIRNHYKMVSEKFNIQVDNVHSFHAGIHPGCSYLVDAKDDPDRWANTVFTNPRVLHFHTCGNYSPGEICWMVIDPTVTVDGRNLWDEGRLDVKDFEQTRKCLSDWPELEPLFESPAQAIGV